MLAVLQRVAQARVIVAGETVGEIGKGLLILLGVAVLDGAEEADLYALAIDALCHIQQRFTPASAVLPPYDEARLLTEASLLVDWFLPAVTGTATETVLREDYLACWRAVLLHASGAAPTLVLRDYHVDNLMMLDRPGLAGVGLLDFQDAVRGPIAYDLVSLVNDARRDVPPALAARLIVRYGTAFPALDRARFDAACAILSAQRNLKIIGIFTRLAARDGKPGYLMHIPRVWRLLESDLRHPALAELRAWLEARVPAARRGVPQIEPVASA